MRFAFSLLENDEGRYKIMDYYEEYKECNFDEKTTEVELK
jgi:hypothetical protein